MGIRRGGIRKRLLLWSPSVLILLFFLFHVETVGIVSHLTRKATFDDGKFQLQLPKNWIVQCADCTNDNQQIGVWAITGKGVLRGWRSAGWRWWNAPYAHIESHSLSDPGEPLQWQLEHYFSDVGPSALSDRTIRGGQMKCAEYRGRTVRTGTSSTLADRFVNASCFGKDDKSKSLLRITFVGTPEMLPEFYQFVDSNVSIR